MATNTLYINSDNTITADEVKFATDGSYANAATTTFTLRDADLAVFGGVEDVSMGYVAASNGKYQGTLESTIAATLTPGASYFVDVTYVQGSVVGFQRAGMTAYYKGAT